MPEFRPNTEDELIWHWVVKTNEYRLPKTFAPEDVILDIGGHIGAFVHAAVSRGAGLVESYECHPENFAVLERNCASLGKHVALHRAAVWRSDGRSDELFMRPLGSRTGGQSLFFGKKTDLPVETSVTLDSVLERIPNVRLLKIDVEGAEYPILLTSKLLGKVSELCGEYHEIETPSWAAVDGFPSFTWPVLVTFLMGLGYGVEIVPTAATHGLFFAKRPEPPHASP